MVTPIDGRTRFPPVGPTPLVLISLLLRRSRFPGPGATTGETPGRLSRVTSLLPNLTPDPLVDRVLAALLSMQRYSWEQGVASHALLDLGQEALVEVVARDAVTHQSAEGNLADLRES